MAKGRVKWFNEKSKASGLFRETTATMSLFTSLMGRYVQDAIGAGAIVFSSIATSKRLSEDPRMAVEERVINVLRSSTNVKVTGNTLRFDGSAGKLDFTAPMPVPPPPPPK